MKKCAKYVEDIFDKSVSAIKTNPRIYLGSKDDCINRARAMYKKLVNEAKKLKKPRPTNECLFVPSIWAATNPGEYDNNIHEYSDAIIVASKILIERELAEKVRAAKKARKEANIVSQ